MIDDGRIEPFKKGRIGRPEEIEGFYKVPPIHIQDVRERQFNDIAELTNAQIIFERAYINKADIVIAVRRLKPPRTTP